MCNILCAGILIDGDDVNINVSKLCSNIKTMDISFDWFDKTGAANTFFKQMDLRQSQESYDSFTEVLRYSVENNKFFEAQSLLRKQAKNLSSSLKKEFALLGIDACIGIASTLTLNLAAAGKFPEKLNTWYRQKLKTELYIDNITPNPPGSRDYIELFSRPPQYLLRPQPSNKLHDQ